MKNTVFGIVALLVVALAVYVLVNNMQRDGGQGGDPALLGKDGTDFLESVTDISIASFNPNQRVDLNYSAEKGWVVKQVHGYYADRLKLKKLFLALSDARLAEKKTDNPEKYADLQLAGADDADHSGVVLSMQNDDESRMFEVILGAPATGLSDAQYVRIAGQRQSWVSNRSIPVGSDAQKWLDREILHIEPVDLMRVAIMHLGFPDENIEAVRSARGEDLQVVDAAADSSVGSDPAVEPDWLPVLRQAVGAVEYMRMIGVDLRGDEPTIDLQNPGEVVGVYTTFDGLTVESHTYQEYDNRYTALKVFTDEQVMNDRGLSEDKKLTVRSQAHQLNERVSGWLFRIGPTLYDALTVSRVAAFPPPLMQP